MAAETQRDAVEGDHGRGPYSGLGRSRPEKIGGFLPMLTLPRDCRHASDKRTKSEAMRLPQGHAPTIKKGNQQ